MKEIYLVLRILRKRGLNCYHDKVDLNLFFFFKFINTFYNNLTSQVTKKKKKNLSFFCTSGISAASQTKEEGVYANFT